MTWRSPSWLILGILLLIGTALLFWRSKAGSSSRSSFLHLVPAEGRWAIRNGPRLLRRRPWLLILAGFLSVLALAGPQWGQGPRQLLRPSIDLVIALDLSRSMTVSDLAPSRLDRAKLLIRTFLQEAAGQRIGLLVFSNSAQLAVPLTTDYRAIEELLSELGPDSLPEAGTDFTALLEEASDTFAQSDAAHRILLILSDGEDHGSGWKERLGRLTREGVRVYAIGLGTDRGGLIPVPKGGFLKDDEGHPVLSRLQPATLRDLTAATGGRYFRGDRWVSLSEIFGADATADASRSERAWGRTERFAYFLFPAVVCWAAGLLWELPAFRFSGRMRSSAPTVPGSKVPAALLLGLIWLLAIFGAAPARCGPVSAVGRGEKDPLVQCVEALARKDRLSASDCGALVRETISWCRSRQAQGLSVGVISDGLAAVDQGERLDPRLLPWEQLRRELEAFLQAARPPDAVPEDSLSRRQGGSSPKAARYRLSSAGPPMRPEGNGRQGSPPAASAGRDQSPPPSSASVSSDPKNGRESQAQPSRPGAESGAKARLRQVEHLDRPALLFERMRQKEAEQADAPPEPMDW